MAFYEIYYNTQYYCRLNLILVRQYTQNPKTKIAGDDTSISNKSTKVEHFINY